jgi:EAL domain-containing protein (putative c-di-GMP-specific phosphodiesterase class I)
VSRNIEKRSENQLLVQSLVEACKGMPVQVFATGVRSRSEWQVLSMRCYRWSGEFLPPHSHLTQM